VKNEELARDYVKRCQGRIAAIGTLYAGKYWADVVRESQEAVELALKAVLRISGIEPPRIHDVSDVLEKNAAALPPPFRKHLALTMKISRSLRKDREFAFYGSEDLTPSQFYKEADATEAFEWAKKIVGWAVDSFPE